MLDDLIAFFRPPKRSQSAHPQHGCGQSPKEQSRVRSRGTQRSSGTRACTSRYKHLGTPALAAARGRKGGRRRKLSEDDLTMARALLKDTRIPVAQIAKRLSVSRATFYAYFPQARKKNLP